MRARDTSSLDQSAGAWRWARWAMLGAVVTCIARPFFRSTWYGNDEIDRYPGRLELLYQHASLAHPLPRWIPELSGGHGYPLFDFFNPGSMAIALPLRALGVDPFLAMKIAMVGMLIVGGAHAMWLGERVFGKSAGVLAACLYLLAPYTVANLYHRGDYAELWAMLLMPAAAYHGLALRDTRRARHFFGLAIAWALLVPAHAFSALLFAMMFAVGWAISVWRARRGLAERRCGLVLVTAASVLGVAIATIYWLPALAEKHSVHVDTFFSIDRLMASAMTTDDLLDPTPEGRIAGPRRLTLGLWMPILMLASLVASYSRPRVPGRRRVLGLALGVAFCLLMTTAHGGPIYETVPLIGQILFPYRFFSLASLMAMLAGSAAPSLVAPRRAPIASMAACAATLFFALRFLTVLNPWEPEPGHSDFVGRAEREWILFDYGEYYPIDARQPPFYREPSPYATTAGCTVDHFAFADLRHRFDVSATRSCEVRLRQLKWLGWHATIDGAPSEIRADREGRMVLDVPLGSHRFEVWWEETRVERSAAIASWIAIAMFIALLVARLAMRDWRENLRAWWTAPKLAIAASPKARQALAAARLAYGAGFYALAIELAERSLSGAAPPPISGSDRARAIARLRSAGRSLPHWRSWVAWAPLAIALVAAAIALWPRPREVAHTNGFLGGDPSFGAERAIDGLDTTQWLALDRNPGWLDVTLLPPRYVREIELVNARDLDDSQRSTERYRVRVLDDRREVATHAGVLPAGGRAVIAVGQHADRIRFEVVSWRGSGGGLTELMVR